jgi:tetratricopeptide (TPR) repeat protein
MLAMVCALGRITAQVERQTGAVGAEFQQNFAERLLISGRSFWFYLGKLAWPSELSFIYPRWDVPVNDGWEWVFPSAMLALLAGFWLARRWLGKGPFVAAAHYFICTSALILWMTLYMMRYSFVWDHWQYFGAMGVFVLAGAGIARRTELFSARRLQINAAAVVLLLVLGAMTWRQAGMYSNVETLWRTTLERNPNCGMAHACLGGFLFRENRYDEAIEQYHEAIKLNPNLYEAYYSLGVVLRQKGQLDEAIEDYRSAIQINPKDCPALNALGVALTMKVHSAEAIDLFEQVIEINPYDPGVLVNFGNAFTVIRS